MQPMIAARRLIFLDETGVTTNMVRRWGRAPKGQRVKGFAPGGHWRITTFLAGLDRNGIVAPFVVDQPMNRAIVTQYVRQYLAPELEPGDIVICDNLSSPKVPRPHRSSSAKARRCSSCRPTHPISTRSKLPSPNSNSYCERRANEPAKASRTVSASSSSCSRQPNAKTTCAMPDTSQHDHKPL